MKLTAFLVATAIGGAALVAPVQADERVTHYEAKPSETLDEAVTNFSEYNRLLADVLKKEQLSVDDLEQIHQLTYTLEIALAKINEEMAGLPETLERLHLSSEAHNADEARGVGETYLETAQKVVK